MREEVMRKENQSFLICKQSVISVQQSPLLQTLRGAPSHMQHAGHAGGKGLQGQDRCVSLNLSECNGINKLRARQWRDLEEVELT